MFSFLSEGKSFPCVTSNSSHVYVTSNFSQKKVIISPTKILCFRFLRSSIFNFQKRRKVAAPCVDFFMRKYEILNQASPIKYHIAFLIFQNLLGINTKICFTTFSSFEIRSDILCKKTTVCGARNTFCTADANQKT